MQKDDNVVSYQPKEVRAFLKGTSELDGANKALPDFVKTAFMIGLTAFLAHIVKELTGMLETKN